MRPEDAAAFHDFVRAQWPRLVRAAYLLSGDHAEAEDLAQTALAKAGASWRRVQASDRPETYVRRILINCNKDRFRRKRPTLVLAEHSPEAPVPDESQRIVQRDALSTALRKLPARQRAAVVLRYWEDLPETEVAAIMGCSVGNVKSQAARGLAKLREDPTLAPATASCGAAAPHAGQSRLHDSETVSGTYVWPTAGPGAQANDTTTGKEARNDRA